jgi:hypothetical protein
VLIRHNTEVRLVRLYRASEFPYAGLHVCQPILHFCKVARSKPSPRKILRLQVTYIATPRDSIRD